MEDPSRRLSIRNDRERFGWGYGDIYWHWIGTRHDVAVSGVGASVVDVHEVIVPSKSKNGFRTVVDTGGIALSDATGVGRCAAGWEGEKEH